MSIITIIGGGNLGRAIADGLLESGITPSNIRITRRNTAALRDLSDKGVHVSANNLEAVSGSAIVFLCVKPYKMQEIVAEISPNLNSQIVISTITGITLNAMAEMTDGTDVTLFRAMPNTAAAIKESMTCISEKGATQSQKDTVETLFKSLGETIYIEDELMAAATVLAASGIAFALRYIRAATQGGIEIGFSSAVAQKICAQTLKGAASLILQDGAHPESEIDKVTTPQGITITGLNKMEKEGFSSSLIQGILASQDKIKKI